jgi:hypothetical protein
MVLPRNETQLLLEFPDKRPDALGEKGVGKTGLALRQRVGFSLETD